jgi:hypothetical protein
MFDKYFQFWVKKVVACWWENSAYTLDLLCFATIIIKIWSQIMIIKNNPNFENNDNIEMNVRI